MPQRQFDIALGGRDADVTSVVGSSISTSAVRITVDDTNCKNKNDAIQCIEYILNRIKEGVWPPA